MSIELILLDGDNYRFPDIEYDAYTDQIEWAARSCSSDMAYKEYLEEHNMVEPESLRLETYQNSVLVIKDGDKVITFKCISAIDSTDPEESWSTE